MERHPYGRCYPWKSYLKMAKNGLKRMVVEGCGQGLLAERVGFEPTIPKEYTGFRDRRFRPLSHLSVAT